MYVDKTGLFFNLHLFFNLTFHRDPSHGGMKSKQWVMVLLARNTDGSVKLPPLVTGK
jgi:hypothetical protein